MRKKALYSMVLAGTLLMAGCGNKAGSQTTAADAKDTTAVESSVEQGEKEGTEVTGMVKEISDTELTLMTGGPGGGGQRPNGAPGDGQGQDSNQKSEDGQGWNGGQKSGNGQGRNNDQKPGDGQSQNGDQKSGDGQSQNDGQPGGTTTTITLTSATEYLDTDNHAVTSADITSGTMVTVTVDEANTALTIQITAAGQPGGMGGQGGPGGPGGGQSAPTSYSAVTEYTTDTEESGTIHTSTGTDENAIHVTDGAAVTLSNITLNRTSTDSTGGDSSSFYGVGAGILVTDGTLNLKSGTITTDSKGGAGVFSYGQGVANVSDLTINTTQDTSGGIHVAGGGTLHATNLNVTTAGESSAAIRSDRGGGTMTVDGGTYTSNGTGSPAVYCTADLDIQNADLIANGSEAVCIEGLNSLKLTDCNLTGNIPENEQNDCNWNIIVYQSMSGDSEVGNGVFEMTGGTLTANNGGMFYTTNTESTFNLSNVTIVPSASNEFFLKCTGNANKRGWGQTGSNGADCQFTAASQQMEGDVIWDSISQLDFYMNQNSKLTGAFLQDETAAGDGGNGYANVNIDSTSTWIVTGDSRVSALSNKGTIKDQVGKTVTIKGEDGTVYVDGDSTVTITVDSYTE